MSPGMASGFFFFLLLHLKEFTKATAIYYQHGSTYAWASL
jgi:hypothetical protein